ncbi:MAG: type II toxin-antitoxin system PrlF family antitoxin [Candidatus Omnitrophota bacterium]
MHLSVVTSKGQTTIPKEIRNFLHLKARDTIVYITDGERVFLKPLKGNILDVMGMVKTTSKKAIDFSALREDVKAEVAKETKKEAK